MELPPSPPRASARSTSFVGVGVPALAPQPPLPAATSPGQPRIASFRNLVNREGYLPSDRTRWPSRDQPAAPVAGAGVGTGAGRASLVEVAGLDRGGRVQLEGVFLNNVCSLRKFQIVNLNHEDSVVVRLGSTLGDQLRWQLRNDNLDQLRTSNDQFSYPSTFISLSSGCDRSALDRYRKLTT